MPNRDTKPPALAPSRESLLSHSPDHRLQGGFATSDLDNQVTSAILKPVKTPLQRRVDAGVFVFSTALSPFPGTQVRRGERKTETNIKKRIKSEGQSALKPRIIRDIHPHCLRCVATLRLRRTYSLLQKHGGTPLFFE